MKLVHLYITILAMAVVGFLLNYLLLRWTRTLGTKNQTDNAQVRWSNTQKPAIGGISFYITFLLAYMTYLVSSPSAIATTSTETQMAVLLAVSVGFFTGLADDAFNTVPWLKFGTQVLCGLVLVAFDVRILFFDHVWADVLLTVFWTVAVMNSINMLDNMDGVTATVSIGILVSAGLCSFPPVVGGMYFPYVCGGVVAALCSFLWFNWHPSKMFMGDTGSQMLGALLAAVGVVFFWNGGSPNGTNIYWLPKLVVVATAFVIPIADSLTVTINRILRGQSPFVGGRDHTTHHLGYAGLGDGQVALVISGFSLVSVLLVGLVAWIPADILNSYFAGMGIYTATVIVFLYSTTRWKKTREVFKTKNLAQ